MSIPPELVRILRDHIAAFGVGSDGRVFSSSRARVVASTAISDVWAEARTLALTPEQVASPLAGRPYDLRHAAEMPPTATMARRNCRARAHERAAAPAQSALRGSFRVARPNGSQYTDVAEPDGSAYSDVVQLDRSEYTEVR